MTTLTVQLSGGPPWGFRLHGGRGQNMPLTVAKVRRKSKSYGHLVEGDEVSHIGGRSVDGLSHDEAMALVDSHQDKIDIEIVRGRLDSAPTDNGQAPAGFSSVSSPGVISATPTAVGPAYSEQLGHPLAMDGLSSSGRPQQNAIQVPSAFVDTPPPKQLPSDGFGQQYNVGGAHNGSTSTMLPPQNTTTTTTSSSSDFTATTQQQQTITASHQRFQASNDTSSTMPHGQYPVELPKHAPQVAGAVPDSAAAAAASTVTNTSASPGDMNTPREMRTTTESANPNNSATTVNISGSKFDFGSDFTTPTPFGAGGVKAPQLPGSNPFAGVERILESETRSSKEQIPGGEHNRLETHEKKITPEGAYVQSHTLSEHKVSSTSSRTPLSVSVKPTGTAMAGHPDDDILLYSPTGRPIKERYYKPLPDDQLKEIDDIMAPILSKKKVFTSSSFYEDANSTYPTVEEQVGMARKIAESLSSDSNAQSKGANMFFRRVKRSHKWVHQAPGISESEYTESEDCSTCPDPDKFPGVKISKEPPKLKLLMAPSAQPYQWDQANAGQDVTASPEVCLDIVKGLNSPGGKGSQMFAKRKKKSEDWVVDVDKLKAQLGDRWPEKDKAENEENINTPQPQPSEPATPSCLLSARPPVQAPRIKETSKPADRYLEQINQQSMLSRVRLVKSPWEAALESPVGAVDAAFQTITQPIPVANWRSNGASVRNPTAPLSMPPVGEVGTAPMLDPLTAATPRGWAQGGASATKNVCVTVNKDKPPRAAMISPMPLPSMAPPPPPPRPDKIRPVAQFQATGGAQPPFASGRPVGPLRLKSDRTPPGPVGGSAGMPIEAGPPARFFHSYEEFSQNRMTSHVTPVGAAGVYAPQPPARPEPVAASGFFSSQQQQPPPPPPVLSSSCYDPLSSTSSRLISSVDCQNFNAAPRGFGFGGQKASSNFRSVRL